MNYGKYSVGIRLLLLKEYFEANAGKNRLVSRRQLEAYLDNQDFPIEKKTLYADLNALKDYFGMQIEYDQRKNAYSGGQRPPVRSTAAAVRPNGHPNIDS